MDAEEVATCAGRREECSDSQNNAVQRYEDKKVRKSEETKNAFGQGVTSAAEQGSRTPVVADRREGQLLRHSRTGSRLALDLRASAFPSP